MTPNPAGSVPAVAVGAASLAAALVKGQGQEQVRQGPGRLFGVGCAHVTTCLSCTPSLPACSCTLNLKFWRWSRDNCGWE